MVLERAVRGKMEVSVEFVMDGIQESYTLNDHLIKSYYKSLDNIVSEVNADRGNILQAIMRLPNVVSVQNKKLDSEEWDMIQKTITEALDDLMSFRAREGVALHTELKQRANNIINLLGQVQDLEKDRSQHIKNKLKKSLEAIKENVRIDESRYEQELIYYMEKLDITEEKVRLKEHCAYFLKLINSDSIEKGRKLGFISQEMGREINTMGSKSQHAALQRIVVEMKDELEKIKEQSLNVL